MRRTRRCCLAPFADVSELELFTSRRWIVNNGAPLKTLEIRFQGTLRYISRDQSAKRKLGTQHRGILPVLHWWTGTSFKKRQADC